MNFEPTEAAAEGMEGARPRVRAVLFDVAGTLIELRAPAGHCYAQVAERHGVSVPAGRLTEAFVRVFGNAAPMLFPGVSSEELAEREKNWWRERVRETFRAADGTVRFTDFDAYFEDLFALFSTDEVWRAIDGACEVMNVLRDSGLRLAVVSNFDSRLPQLLDALGLLAYFEFVLCAGEVGVAKPDPRIFEAALERLDLRAEEVFFVGDHPERDVAAAQALGMQTIWIDSPATLRSVPERLATLQ